MLMDLYDSLLSPPYNISNEKFSKEKIKQDFTLGQLLEWLELLPSDVNSLSTISEVIEFGKELKEIEGLSLYMHKHEGIPVNHITINGKTYINYSTYNYIGLNGDNRVIDYAKKIIDIYGTSVSGSRLLCGEIEEHQKFEKMISDFIGVDDAIVQVSAHSTNVNIIGALVGVGDLIIHDSLAHNSIIQGALSCGAKRKFFRHNDIEHLASELERVHKKYNRILIVVEGVYSMDGDICKLHEILDLKEKDGAFLMIDEAHSLGTIGKNGRGVTSYFNVNSNRVDILMGTLSKSLSSCGGYIAGKKEFINFLKYKLQGFIFSAELLRRMLPPPTNLLRLCRHLMTSLINYIKIQSIFYQNLKSLDLILV
jgi:7-keto-8-aminopelargonate synthetase-like enzyme